MAWRQDECRQVRGADLVAELLGGVFGPFEVVQQAFVGGVPCAALMTAL
jgi:hypothetical protein